MTASNGSSKGNSARIALHEADVLQRSIYCPGSCHQHRLRSAVGADYAPFCAHDARGQERDVAGPATDIQHPHAGIDTGRSKEAFCDRVDQLRLSLEPVDLALRMPEHVCVFSLRCVLVTTHRSVRKSEPGQELSGQPP